MPDPHTELRAAAEKATCGEWGVILGSEGSNWINAGQYDEVVAPAPVACMSHCYGGTSQIELSDADAAFIAAASPHVVLSLLHRLGLAEYRLSEVRETVEQWGQWQVSTTGGPRRAVLVDDVLIALDSDPEGEPA